MDGWMDDEKLRVDIEREEVEEQKGIQESQYYVYDYGYNNDEIQEYSMRMEKSIMNTIDPTVQISFRRGPRCSYPIQHQLIFL